MDNLRKEETFALPDFSLLFSLSKEEFFFIRIANTLALLLRLAQAAELVKTPAL